MSTDPMNPDAMARALMRTIKQEMDDRAFTQTRMGEVLDLTQGQVSRLLNGKRGASANELIQMCDALGVPLSVVAARAAALVELEGR